MVSVAITVAKSPLQLRILAIRLLLSCPLRADLGGIPDPQLKLQLRQQTLKPAGVPAGFHSYTHRPTTRLQFPVELLRFLAMPQSPFFAISRLGIDESDLLKARVIITSLYLAGNCPMSSLHGSWRLDRVSAGGRSHPEAH
jgi:hypothetical protein